MTSRGYCPLNWVAFRGLAGRSPVEAARLLLEAGADLHATTKCEVANSALILASQAGAGSVVRLLVESGADIHANCGNTTPLIAASISGCGEAVRLLLSLGADATVKGPFGRTALEWAESTRPTLVPEDQVRRGARDGPRRTHTSASRVRHTRFAPERQPPSPRIGVPSSHSWHG